MFEPEIMCFSMQVVHLRGRRPGRDLAHDLLPEPVNLRVMCSSRVDPQHILYAFRQGADGVFIGGCHPGDCHYVEGNYKTLRRVILFKNDPPRPGNRPAPAAAGMDLGR